MIEFCLAKRKDDKKILQMYKSVLGNPFCVWTENYPTMVDIDLDLKTEGLYILKYSGEIAGAISVENENDLDFFENWQERNARQIARVVIAPLFQGRNLGEFMANEISLILKNKGYKAIHLAVAKRNIPAYKTYEKTGFILKGEATVFGGDYFLMEKIL